MADNVPVPVRGKREKALRRLIDRALPEWQVFQRRPNGATEHFIFTRKRQLAWMAGVSLLAVWACTTTLMLAHRPDELAAKERELEEMMATTRAAQHRLMSSQKVVGDIAREVDTVHANLMGLAESNASLARDRAPSRPPAVPAVAKVKLGGEPSWNDDGQPGSDEARGMREQVRRLEASLERLRSTYAHVVQATAEVAGGRIGDAERIVGRLGLDAQSLLQRFQRESGRGGPFVALPAALQDGGLSDLLSRMDHWQETKAVLQRLPLGEPLHQVYETNSGFGARNDPLNNRTGVHEGIDFGAPFGSPIYATGEGVVTLAGPWDRYGLTVDIDHGNGISTRYAHLSRIKVREGQKVTRSTVLGLLGNTGRSTGAHLHYEVRVADTPRDPIKFISAGRDAPKVR